MDLEVASDHDFEEQASALERLTIDLERLGLPTTVFSTANAAARFGKPLIRLARAGHEVGCHGLTHAPTENYRVLPPQEARTMIGEATESLRVSVSETPTSFRGPYMSTSVAAQRALLDRGYLFDFSVCAQRVDVLTARGASLGWLRAPRCPYHPSTSSPYVRGALPLWVVPLRSFGAPFISALLYLGGLSLARRFFDALLAESRQSGAPIVYIFHSYEFSSRREGNPNAGPIYHRLYLNDRSERYRRNLALFEYMMRPGEVRPITARELRL